MHQNKRSSRDAESQHLSVRWPQKLVLLLCSTMTVMAGATISPAIPLIEEAFAETPNAGYLASLVLTTPGLFVALSAFPMGMLIDRAGRKWPLLLMLVLYGLAGGSGLVLDELRLIIVGRALLGVAVAGVMTAAVTLISDYFDGDERERFMGLQAACMAFGGTVYVYLGGRLAEESWRGPFAVYLVALPLMVAVAALIPEPERPRSRNSADDAAPEATPRTPKALLAVLYIQGVLGMLMFYFTPVAIPYLMREIGDSSPAVASYPLIVSTLASTLASLAYRRLRQSLTFTEIFVFLWGFVIVGYGLLSRADSLETVLLAVVFSGIGFGIVMPNLNVWVAAIAPPHLRGSLLGGLTMSIFLGQFLSAPVVRFIEDRSAISGTFGVYGICAQFAGVLLVGYGAAAAFNRLRPRTR